MYIQRGFPRSEMELLDGRVADSDELRLADVPIAALVAEVEARISCDLDLGISQQVCPRCSTASLEVFGEYSRVERRFSCPACRSTLAESRYEIEIDRFERQRWRARRDAAELAKLARNSL